MEPKGGQGKGASKVEAPHFRWSRNRDGLEETGWRHPGKFAALARIARSNIGGNILFEPRLVVRLTDLGEGFGKSDMSSGVVAQFENGGTEAFGDNQLKKWGIGSGDLVQQHVPTEDIASRGGTSGTKPVNVGGERRVL